MNRTRIEDRLLAHLVEREGCRNQVYRDSLGKLTVGIGHLVVPEDKLTLGSYITDDRMLKLARKDMKRAIDAASKQAAQLGRKSEDFIVAIASVCFQLGADWPRVFHKSFPALERGDTDMAIEGFERSLWARQTPVRVKDFVAAIRKEYGRQEEKPAA